MKLTGLLAVLTVAILAGCASPQLASRPLHDHEQQWSNALADWYPAWKKPYVAPVILTAPTASSSSSSHAAPFSQLSTPAPSALAMPIHQILLPSPEAAAADAEIELVPVDRDQPDASSAMTYVVSKGDTLHKIAAEKLGDAGKWRQIWESNRDILPQPADLQPGMVLHLGR